MIILSVSDKLKHLKLDDRIKQQTFI